MAPADSHVRITQLLAVKPIDPEVQTDGFARHQNIRRAASQRATGAAAACGPGVSSLRAMVRASHSWILVDPAAVEGQQCDATGLTSRRVQPATTQNCSDTTRLSVG